MGRNDWVQFGDRIVPATLFEADLKQRSAGCKMCGDTGVQIDCIDEERYDVVVPCWACRTFCKACNKHVKKSGHQCVVPVPEKEAQL
jgi:hypothetical protein